MLHVTWHNLFITIIPFPTIMKLVIMLLAIYSLIFYQQYKIQRSNASLRESASKIVRTLGTPVSVDQQDFKTTNFLIGNSDTKTKQPQISRARYFQ